MIQPFCDNLEQEGKLSYGLSSFGYDLRLSDKELLCFDNNSEPAMIDPKDFPKERARQNMDSLALQGGCFLLPPFAHALGTTVETIDIPRDVIAFTCNKSTYRRCGVGIPKTAAEPGWKGHLTLEINNKTPHYIPLYANEGICQIIFQEGEPCEQSYRDRQGKYLDQAEQVVFPKTI